MKHRSQKVRAVVMVTAALCADRAVAAAPAAKPAVGQIASRLVSRLTRNLGRAVTSVKLHQDPSVHDRPVLLVAAEPIAPAAVHSLLSPFQFRLPPPTA
jgi:hypothetical protein